MQHAELSSFEREARAGRLARETCVLPPAVAEFDSALATWLTTFTAIEEAHRGSPHLPPVLAASGEDVWLGASLARLAGPARIYAWARLWKAYDLLHAEGHGFGAVGHGLARHLVDARPRRVPPATIMAVHEYFEDIVDSPTSGLYHALWERTRAAGLLRRRAGAERDDALLRFVRLLERRPHHHQLRDVRRVLYALRRGDDRAAAALHGFAPRSEQGAALFAGQVIRTVGLRAQERRPGLLAGRVMHWFLAGRSRPKRAWVAARAELGRVIGDDAFDALARWVRARAQVEGAAHEGLRDELFGFLSRSSAWLLAAPC